MTVIDSCIVLDLADPKRPNHALSTKAVHERLKVGKLYSPDIVFAEVSAGYPSAKDTRTLFEELGIEVVSLGDEALFLAAHAFWVSKKPRREAQPSHAATDSNKRILPDFYVGALAESEGIPLLTRDAKRKWKTHFPNLQLIIP
jgi:predicted nucleic acid-binding protein